MIHVALIDHGAGNLRSVQKALEAVGAEVLITDKPDQILAADKVLLPGVGAFADVMNGVESRNLVPVLNEVVDRNQPLLGICVGMQLLFEYSVEFGHHAGLGYLPGFVDRFESGTLKVPQTGWNVMRGVKGSVILEGLSSEPYAYFNHSFYCKPAQRSDVLGETDYGIVYASVVGRDRIYGVQFHPEKSQQVGLRMLRNFVEKG